MHPVNDSLHVQRAQSVLACLSDPACRRLWQVVYFKRVVTHDDAVVVSKLPGEHVATMLSELEACGLVARVGEGKDARYSARVPSSALGLWKCC